MLTNLINRIKNLFKKKPKSGPVEQELHNARKAKGPDNTNYSYTLRKEVDLTKKSANLMLDKVSIRYEISRFRSTNEIGVRVIFNNLEEIKPLLVNDDIEVFFANRKESTPSKYAFDKDSENIYSIKMHKRTFDRMNVGYPRLVIKLNTTEKGYHTL